MSLMSYTFQNGIKEANQRRNIMESVVLEGQFLDSFRIFFIISSSLGIGIGKKLRTCNCKGEMKGK